MTNQNLRYGWCQIIRRTICKYDNRKSEGIKTLKDERIALADGDLRPEGLQLF